ncbi:DsrE/DsrF/DrsH-like family protein [Intrasporangium calvum]|uniref:DsrE/DsrF/DrsH-like family protein n=1 Tax=Intrasporangium calvum TaxID=53358 RepID=A0ABT5GHT4_9MICO|nr:DsrE/DsrF/DrsH-like family protein [Intrasporangium calvum]MDC5697496.1 DsrE/DsrF/DrsH-like family protein [Intrasporangium calvum]
MTEAVADPPAHPLMQPAPPPEEAAPEAMTIVAWSGDLDRIWPTLILGSTGAAYGMQTTIFFTFWGLFPLVRDDVRITGTNAMTKALAGMNRPGISNMKLSKLHMAGAGPRMMAKLAKDQDVSPPKELLEMCVELGVNLWPCEMTMELLGLRPDQLIDGVGEPVGAATALSAMSRSQINLFI